MRRFLLFLSVALLAAAAVLVPLPWLAIESGPTLETSELVSVSAEADQVDLAESSGSYLVTSVLLTEPSLVGTVANLLDDSAGLVAREVVVPSGIDEERFTRIQRRLFEEGTRLAWAVGLREAGVDVDVSGSGAEVLGIGAAVPASDVLETGDVITAIDGRPVRLAPDAVTAIADRAAGEEVVIEFMRDDEQMSETVELVQLRDTDAAGLGVLLRTVNRTIEMPVDLDVEVADREVGGSSGGLMVALAAYDRANDSDLARGRTIAGTGTIDIDGAVGPVGGTSQKVLAAIDAGADVFLVPETSAEAARSAADDQIEVLAVENLSEAIDALSNG